MSRSVYRVLVGREGSQFVATVEGLLGASTFGSNMSELDTSVREVVVLAANLPDEAIDAFDLEWIPESAIA